MTPEIKQQIINHAREAYPAECCGLVVLVDDVPQYRPCRNISGNKDVFALHPEDYASAEDDGCIIAVVHSHPDASSQPSEADRVACEASGLMWHIVGLRGDETEFTTIAPCGYEAPLIGRSFAHGVLDCYSLIRDWYKLHRGIVIPDFERKFEWWYKGENLYLENFGKAGFVEVVGEEPREGDVLLMQILANVPNHGAIYVGHGMILHHLFNRLSCREVWGGYYRKHTVKVLRHVDAAQGDFIR